MISLNGTICNASTFDWLNDSGFRYGFGCFETILIKNQKIPLFDYHYRRLEQSLKQFKIPFNSSKETLMRRIFDLYAALKLQDGQYICRIYITGGASSPMPQFEVFSNEIISIQRFTKKFTQTPFVFKTVSPHEFYKFKSMNYAHHLIEIKDSFEWPIYVDSKDRIIDSTIFSVGIIKNKQLYFAKHDYQLPSVSRQALMDLYPSLVFEKKLTKSDILNADVAFGSNAIQGIFKLGNFGSELNEALPFSVHWL